MHVTCPPALCPPGGNTTHVEEVQEEEKRSPWTELEIRGPIKNLSPELWKLTHLTALFLNDNNLQVLGSCGTICAIKKLNIYMYMYISMCSHQSTYNFPWNSDFSDTFYCLSSAPPPPSPSRISRSTANLHTLS